MSNATQEPGARHVLAPGFDSSWYYGTRRGFRPGGYLFPRSWHHGLGTTAPVNPGTTPPQDAGNWVYLTRDLNVAWVYATPRCWSCPRSVCSSRIRSIHLSCRRGELRARR